MLEWHLQRHWKQVGVAISGCSADRLQQTQTLLHPQPAVELQDTERRFIYLGLSFRKQRDHSIAWWAGHGLVYPKDKLPMIPVRYLVMAGFLHALLEKFQSRHLTLPAWILLATEQLPVADHLNRVPWLSLLAADELSWPADTLIRENGPSGRVYAEGSNWTLTMVMKQLVFDEWWKVVKLGADEVCIGHGWFWNLEFPV